MKKTLVLASLGAMLIAGCSKRDTEPAVASASAASASVAATAPHMAPAVPDAGKLESVATQAEGLGGSAPEAVAEAMRLAILQVNGAELETSTIRVKFGLETHRPNVSEWLRGDALAAAVRDRSGGVIQSMKVLELVEPAKPGQAYRARIEAQIAKFRPPAELGKLKVVVAQPRFRARSLAMGDGQVPADEVAALIKQQVADALNNTGRFVVLDREFSPELMEELAQIDNGEAPAAERARLSQAVSADVIWTINVTSMDYRRFSRQLRATDRELVSYSGGWSATHRLVNVATRHVMVSEALAGGRAPGTEPTTLGHGVDGQRILAGMTGQLVDQAVASLIKRTFPITIVSREGDSVVLSQGGKAVHEGARYAVVAMGAELKDTQTGQSLGRTESPCCEVQIERVTPALSYGRLVGASAAVYQLPPGALQLRDELPPEPAARSAVAATGAGATGPRSAAHAANKPAPVASSSDDKVDDKW